MNGISAGQLMDEYFKYRLAYEKYQNTIGDLIYTDRFNKLSKDEIKEILDKINNETITYIYNNLRK